MLVTQLCLSLCDPMDCSPLGSSALGNCPGKNTGVGCHSLLQGICLTQESNLGLPHCRKIPYHLSHQGSPNRNKVHYKCNALESSPNHPSTTPVCWKIIFHDTRPWCRKGWELLPESIRSLPTSRLPAQTTCGCVVAWVSRRKGMWNIVKPSASGEREFAKTEG